MNNRYRRRLLTPLGLWTAAAITIAVNGVISYALLKMIARELFQ